MTSQPTTRRAPADFLNDRVRDIPPSVKNQPPPCWGNRVFVALIAISVFGFGRGHYRRGPGEAE